MKPPIGLYVHVPFCKTKCNYCNFYSIEYNESAADFFKTAAVRHVHDFARREQIRFDTVFFGGGTPSLLGGQVCEILAAAPLTEGAEITVECNPDDADAQLFGALRRAGVNRLSIGVQSLDDRILRALGRRHDSRTARAAVELANAAGFTNISADIMLGIPEQTRVDAVHELPLTHISAYLFEAARTLPERDCARLYLQAVEQFAAHGFAQYEISNFGLPCRHNLKYWRCEEYFGVGPTAHSYYGGRRFAMSEGGESREDWEISVTEENPGSREERVMLGLRLAEGITADDALLERARRLPQEYLRINERNLSLTAKGFLVSNMIIAELLG
jgi:oxygen-independent coproporphyrinogen-3 oxidase